MMPQGTAPTQAVPYSFCVLEDRFSFRVRGTRLLLDHALPFLDVLLTPIEANLALDEALLDAIEAGDLSPLVRIWESPTEAIILGASCKLVHDVDFARCRAEGVPIFRRSSGGGTVLIGPGALNATVILPIKQAPGLTAVDRAQRFVLEPLADQLRLRGFPCRLQGSSDLTLGDRKCAGSAQRRLRSHFLVHTSILYRFPLERIALLLKQPVRQPEYRRDRSHDDFLINLSLSREDLCQAIQQAWNASPDLKPAGALPMERISELLQAKFSLESWIYRF
jgi:lipoate-protein ligase A